MITDSKGVKNSILVIIPARGGSKGVKLKNIRKVGNYNLIEHVAKVLNGINIIDRKIVSTDNEKISKAAKNSGLSVPFCRPQSISGSNVADMPVLKHALIKIEEIDKKKYDIILMLQPTSPFRTKEIIIKSIKKLVMNNLDSVWTVSSIDLKFHADKQVKENNLGFLEYVTPNGKKIVNRQMLKPTLIRNGIAYVFKRKMIIRENMLPRKTGFIICKGIFPNIDTHEDLKQANDLYTTNNKFFN